jgi:cobalt-zinc-cadmium efflux system membrane fusion protein
MTRIVLSAILLGAGMVLGAAVPPVSGFLRSAIDWSSAAFGQGNGTLPAVRTAIGGSGPGERAHADAEGEEGHVRMSAEQIAAQGVTLTVVAGGIIDRHMLVPGTIVPDADRIARVPARVVGTVAQMRKRLGDVVREGEIVAVLDSREVADAKSEYLTATVKADAEKINFDRQRALWDQRVAPEAAFLTARAVYLDAALRQDLARQKLLALGLDADEVDRLATQDRAGATSTLRQYELRSPLGGRIVERKVDVGMAVGKEGDPPDLYTVADLSTVWVELSVPTAELSNVKEGARVIVASSHGESGLRGEGHAIFVSPLLNLETRAARVIVGLRNDSLAWRPGTYVTAELEIARDLVAVRVPKSALQTIKGKPVVFVRTEEGFERREVQLGRSDDDAFEIVSGLTPGEGIAVANSFLLKAELAKSDAAHEH